MAACASYANGVACDNKDAASASPRAWGATRTIEIPAGVLLRGVRECVCVFESSERPVSYLNSKYHSH